ncbi:sensor histidine kinase [Candidatus Fokinia crypta]|uniref:sensor histidine kinase n=1 Tax=Candidatus Fokinia crypta TaxID=1920990 RepID=UPI002B257A73|nr:HAMP domain-containing sensor histidine kinase [Candidatus Fokinia cryptica]
MNFILSLPSKMMEKGFYLQLQVLMTCSLAFFILPVLLKIPAPFPVLQFIAGAAMISIYFCEKYFQFVPSIYRGTYYYLVLAFSISFMQFFLFFQSLFGMHYLLSTTLILLLLSLFFSYIEVIFLTVPSFFVALLISAPIPLSDDGFSQLTWELENYREHGFLLVAVSAFLLVVYQHLNSTVEKKLDRKEIVESRLLGFAIAHEVNAPIATLRMLLDSLQKIINNARNDDILELKGPDIAFVCDRLLPHMNSYLIEVSNLISTLLQSIRISKTKDNKISTGLSLSNTVIRSLRELYQEKPNIKFNIIEDFIYNSPSGLLKSIINNIIQNALVHGGRKDVEVIVEVRKNNVTIVNNGESIKSNVLSNLFSSMTPETSSPTTQHGIGLAFCRKMCDMLGITISCTSNKEGTSFFMDFPHVKGGSATNTKAIDKKSMTV